MDAGRLQNHLQVLTDAVAGGDGGSIGDIALLAQFDPVGAGGKSQARHSGAFVPAVHQQFGIGGLLLCTMLAGLILIALGLLRAGRLIAFIPYPVTLGFTAGIGVGIAT